MPDGPSARIRTGVEISVVVPVYGCADCLPELHRRLVAAIEPLVGDFELIFVDDRSPDRGWSVLQEIAQRDHRVRVYRMSRNFGQHLAITAGLHESRGNWVVVMDCDLQDPPEDIPRLYAKALDEGLDVVLSRRHERVQPLSRRLAAQAYFRMHNMIAGSDMHTNYTNLSIVSRKVADAFLTLGDRDRQYLLILHWLGFNRGTIEVSQDERHDGKSSYKLVQLLNVAVDGIFFQTTSLLRGIVYFGFALAALGATLAGYTLLVVALGRHLPQWTALPILILFLTGFIILSTGVTGLYVGKIFDQVKGRPLFVIDTRVVDGVVTTYRREVRQEYGHAIKFDPADHPGSR